MTKKLTYKMAMAVMLAAALPVVAQGLDAKQERALTTVAALSNAVVTPAEVGANAVTIGGGGYGDRTAGSVGVSRRWDNHFSTHAAIAYGQSQQPAWKVGATYQWK